MNDVREFRLLHVLVYAWYSQFLEVQVFLCVHYINAMTNDVKHEVSIQISSHFLGALSNVFLRMYLEKTWHSNNLCPYVGHLAQELISQPL